jgi:cytosine/adenosine deaminase-related metal-dependent hydrolase
MMYLHAKWAITGDGRKVFTPAWIGIDGPTIKTTANAMPEDATPENTIELGEATIIPGLMNIHDHISRKVLRIPDDSLPFGARTATLMAQDTNYLILHSHEFCNILYY